MPAQGSDRDALPPPANEEEIAEAREIFKKAQAVAGGRGCRGYMGDMWGFCRCRLYIGDVLG